jgi:hypothetical protein
MRVVLRLFGVTILTLETETPATEPADYEVEADEPTAPLDAATVISNDTYPPAFGFTPWSNVTEDWTE